MPVSSAYAISSSRLPTPEKTIFFGSQPARSVRKSSPPETMSAPAPNENSVRRSARLELERGVGVDVGRRADRLGDLGERDVLAVEGVAAVLEVVHRYPFLSFSKR